MLIVPIKVYAIYQEQDRAVIGPEMDFESLPYFDKSLGQDINSDVPFLAESVTPRPFEDTNFVLKRGVHLHWSLPDFLKRTKYGAASATDFPAVPTRWLVSRFEIGVESPGQQWILESDALLTNLHGAKIDDRAQTSVAVDVNSGLRPYTYLGRTELLEDWITRGGGPTPGYSTWKEQQDNASLTSLGWGSPSFDVFYPNCRSVFGHHDPDGTDQHTYKVVGWYDGPEDDYWLYYLDQKMPDNQGYDKWGSLEIDGLDHLDDDRKAKLKDEQHLKQLREELGIEVKPATGLEASPRRRPKGATPTKHLTENPFPSVFICGYY